MLSGKYRRIYHYHLKKCGGSTLNHWLDTLTFDDRISNGRVWKSLWSTEARSDETGEKFEMILPSIARAVFHWSDVVHGHGPLRMYAPENTFCLTVLRDPIQRLVSQVSDFRRLTDADTLDSPADVRECAQDSRRLPLCDFLEKHRLGGGAKFLNNYLTRALAAGRIGATIGQVVDAEILYQVAQQSLEKDYDLVGLTERMDLTRNALCAMVGLPPARRIPTINATRVPGNPDPEVSDAREILEDLTRVDRMIYERARQLFDQRYRQIAEDYDVAAFETEHAAQLLAGARGMFCDGATRYSVRAPIIGSGFHGRDGTGMESCAVWSGPETRTTLYIPTPANAALSLLVWVRGYAAITQRDQLRLHVDGKPVVHRFEHASDYADLLAVDACSTKSFVRLDIDIDETLDSGLPGTPLHDPRQRGLAFDSYGWRPVYNGSTGFR